MLQILRAFAWMRWRVLDELARAHRRARRARAVVARGRADRADHRRWLLLVPSVIGLAGLGGLPATGSRPATAFSRSRASCILLLCRVRLRRRRPDASCPSMDPTTIVRLLLLPIPRQTLYLAHTAGAISEPWVMIWLPVVASMPVGLGGWRRMAGGGHGALRRRCCSPCASSACSTLSTLLLQLDRARPPAGRDGDALSSSSRSRRWRCYPACC